RGAWAVRAAGGTLGRRRPAGPAPGRREISVGVALGAAWRPLARQSLVESLLLSLAGGAAGLLLAVWTDRLLIRFIPGEAPLELSAAPDLRVLGFTLAACLATALAFGLAPTIAVPRDLAPSLKDVARSVGGGAGARFRSALVVGQMSLSLLLLAAAGLFLTSLVNLRRLDPGLRPSRLVSFSVNPSLNGYGKERSAQYYGALMEKIRA